MQEKFIYKAKAVNNEDTHDTYNGTWHEGNLIFNKSRYYIHPVYNSISMEGHIGRIIIMNEVREDTICRSTGFRDKEKNKTYPNGRLIYENDLFHIGEKKNQYIVKFEGLKVVGVSLLSGEQIDIEEHLDKVMITGNLFDKPTAALAV